MTTLIQAAEQALEAISGSGDFLFNFHDCEPNNEREMQAYQAALAVNEKAITALRQAIALEKMAENERELGIQMGADEPVARVVGYYAGRCVIEPLDRAMVMPDNMALYAHSQPKREWLGLTPEEVKEISLANRPYVVDMVVALEQRLKEKNT